jgi:glycosyltransferase involved in cell wall biosynthesis
MRPLRIFTWHVHGSYLYYLAQGHHEIYLPVKPGRPAGYNGRTRSYPWPDNVHEVPAEEILNLDVDCILYQSRQHYFEDQHQLLSRSQRRLPRIFLEHDPPREHPTDTRHPVDDPNILLVHVTCFNDLMWDCGQTPTCVIEHGVMVPAGIQYTGELDRGLTVVNNMRRRGRRLGADVFARARQAIPLDLVGMGWEEVPGGMGEISHHQLPAFMARYRFFFNPIRYTSLGLAVCEAMMIGMPIIGLATTEMVTTVEDGVSGYLDTDVGRLLDCMRRLLADPEEARMLGEEARCRAQQCFNIERFVRDWDEAFHLVVGKPYSSGLIPGKLQSVGGVL